MEPQQHLKQNLANAKQSLLIVIAACGVLIICLIPIIYYSIQAFEDSFYDSGEIPGWVNIFNVIAGFCFIFVCWALPDSIKAWRNYSKITKTGEAILAELEIIDKHIYVHSVPGGNGINYSYFFRTKEASWKLPGKFSNSYYDVFPGAILKASVLKAPGLNEIAEFEILHAGKSVNKNEEGVILEKAVSEVNIKNYTGDQIIYDKPFLSGKKYYFLFNQKVTIVDLKTFKNIPMGSSTN